MGKLLSNFSRPAISLAAFAMSPIPANFESVEVARQAVTCELEVGRVGLCEEVYVEEPLLVGHSAIEDPWLWIMAAGAATVIGLGAGAALLSFDRHTRNLKSDSDPDNVAMWRIREQESETRAEENKIIRREARNSKWKAESRN